MSEKIEQIVNEILGDRLALMSLVLFANIALIFLVDFVTWVLGRMFDFLADICNSDEAAFLLMAGLIELVVWWCLWNHLTVARCCTLYMTSSILLSLCFWRHIADPEMPAFRWTMVCLLFFVWPVVLLVLDTVIVCLLVYGLTVTGKNGGRP